MADWPVLNDAYAWTGGEVGLMADQFDPSVQV